MAPWLVPRSLCPRRPRACWIVTFSCGERDRTRFIPAQPRALWPANRGSSTKSCITSSASLALNFVPSRSARVLSSLRSVAAARFRASRSSAFICSTVLCVDSSVFYVFGTRTWPASSTMPVLSFAMTAVWASAAHPPPPPHPSDSGEHAKSSSAMPNACGSSPRARETQSVAEESTPFCRFIRPRVGNTSYKAGARVLRTVPSRASGC